MENTSTKLLIEVKLIELSQEEASSSGTQNEEHLQTYSLRRDQERREIYPSVQLGFEDIMTFALVVWCGDPTSYKKVMHNKESNWWMTVMME